MPQIYIMGPTALLPLRRKACWGFFRPNYPKASTGFEPANLGTKGQHGTPRPLKPLITWMYKIIIYSVIALLCKAFQRVQKHFSVTRRVQRVTPSAVYAKFCQLPLNSSEDGATWRTDATYPPHLHFLYLAPNKYRNCTGSSIQHTVRTPRHTTPGFFCVHTH